MASMDVTYDGISVTSSRDLIACSRTEIFSMVRMPGLLYETPGVCSAFTRSLRYVCCLSVFTKAASISSSFGKRPTATANLQTCMSCSV
jgi:hypothetical protein